ncbi:MAG: PAC2 family protein [bacterium]|nr:PAC2 family protein [bacterium]
MGIQGIKIYQRINVKEPIMIAGWPGMGNVALESIDYLRRRLNAVAFAEIDMCQFSAPDMIIVEDGVTKLPELPRQVFYYTAKHPNLIIFESEAQLGGIAGVNLMERILDLAQELKVWRIYTGAAFPLPISHKEPSTVFGVANEKHLKDFLIDYKVKIMEEGQISGLNGLLLGFAAKRGIEAICLLATMPQYAINFPNPKASKAIIEVLGEILDIKVDMMKIDLLIQEIDKKMDMIEEKIKGIFPEVEKKDVEEVDLESEKVPNYIMEKIEKLFKEAKTDKKKAYALKEELDRWDLYKLYEDRFLDLFKEHQ